MNLTPILVTLLALPTLMIAQSDSPPPTLVVTGEGIIRIDPDLAVTRLGASVRDDEASAAQEMVNRIMNDALAAVLALGIPEDQIQTAGISLSPVNSYNRDTGVSTVTGYEARNSLSVRLTDLSLIGAVVDACVKAGANDIQGIDFALEDSLAAEQDALRIAARAARAKATAIAEAMDLELASLRRIHEGGAHILPPQEPAMARMAMADAMPSGAPVQPGQIEVRASLTAEFSLNPKP